MSSPPREARRDTCDCALRLGAAVAVLLSATPAWTSPLPTRDQNPLLGGFGIPAALPAAPAAPGQWSSTLAFNWGSTALSQRAGAQTLLVDIETREARLALARQLSDQLALRAQVPWRYSGAGTLDGVIDSWHDLFGLPEGARPDLPHDQVRLHYTRDQLSVLDLDHSVSGLGDISLELGLTLNHGSIASTTAWLSVKLPTGDASRLTGSGASDVTLAIATAQRFGARWSLFGQAGLTWLGAGDVLADQQRDLAWSAMAGLAWQATRALQLQLQLDGHSAVFGGTQLDFFSEALVLTFGGEYRLQSGWQLGIGISEDVAVETAPDVVLVIAVGRGLPR